MKKHIFVMMLYYTAWPYVWIGEGFCVASSLEQTSADVAFPSEVALGFRVGV